MCPICKTRPAYVKERTKKTGYVDGNLGFITTGTAKVVDRWWACKFCTKHTPTDEYIERMIEDYNNKEIQNAEEK